MQAPYLSEQGNGLGGRLGEVGSRIHNQLLALHSRVERQRDALAQEGLHLDHDVVVEVSLLQALVGLHERVHHHERRARARAQLRHPRFAQTGAALVLTHTQAAPGQRLQDPNRYRDIAAEVLAFLRDRVSIALAAGMRHEQLIVDPGPDFAKTPAQTVALLEQVERLHELERPLLMAISRKDFIGALTGRAPRERLAGTLAALAHGVHAGAHMFRLHDVAAASDFLRVRAALQGALEVRPDTALAEELRYDRLAGPLG